MKKLITCIALITVMGAFTGCGSTDSSSDGSMVATAPISSSSVAAEASSAANDESSQKSADESSTEDNTSSVTDVTESGSNDTPADPTPADDNDFTLVEDTNLTNLSMVPLEGTWVCGDAVITFHDCDWNLCAFDFTSEDGTYIGTARLEQLKLSENDKVFYYNLYTNDGGYVIGFMADENATTPTALICPQSKTPEFVRSESGDTLTRTAEGVKSEDYLGVWACDRCIISINADDDGFYADVDWSYSPGETLRHETWHYTCTYNTENATMECSNGKYTETNRKDENNEDVKVHYTDGTAVFVMRQGTLTWNDNMRDCAEGMTFYPAGM